MPITKSAKKQVGVDERRRQRNKSVRSLCRGNVVKAGRLGGLDRAAEVMRAALNAGKATVVTSSLESGVGIAASAHLAATLPSHPYAHGLATGILLEQDLLTPSLLVRHGAVAPLQKPGLGVEVDMTMVDRYGIGIEGSVSS